MTPLDLAAIAVAGLLAGTINTIVGSGTLITFPLLVALGVPPVTANASNSLGLVPGSISGAVGYRRRLTGQRQLVTRLLPASLGGAVIGALLLLWLPKSAFEVIVPFLIALAVVLVAVGPWLVRRAHLREHARAPWLVPSIGVAGTYGGYFGAAQGVILLALLGLSGSTDVQVDNAIKNVLAAAANAASAVVFALSGLVDWRIALVLAVSSTVGGQVGAVLGQRIPASALRALIILIGTVAFVAMVWP